MREALRRGEQVRRFRDKRPMAKGEGLDESSLTTMPLMRGRA